MRIICGYDEARQTLLRRAPWEESELPVAVRETIRRVFGAELDAGAVVDRILREVREEGDAAVVRYNEAIDGVKPGYPLKVSRREIEASYDAVDAGLVDALRSAADRIRLFHEEQLKHSLRSFEKDGIGQQVRPIEWVGLYVPGTAVVYPSTLLMTALPACVAGVRHLVMVTPAAEDGSIAPLKLVAAHIAGVDLEVYRAGGVQGIAGMAFGTKTIPMVHKICGPGNLFVTLAKKKLYGEVGMDGVFGPSETLVVADESADPELVAADLVAGAEHDELATAVLITPSRKLAEAVGVMVEKGLASLPRAAAAAASMRTRGGAAVVESMEEALNLANDVAAEHVCLHVEDVDGALEAIHNAGAVFSGKRSAESIGDYTAGPSHVMPTGGSARFASPLGVHDFLKVTSIVRLDQTTVDKIGPAAAAIAHAEGLEGHARSIEARLRDKE